MSSLGILSLIISNFFSVVGVLFFGWNASSLIFLYWFENIVIGIYNVLKMLVVKGKFINANDGKEYNINKAKIIFIPFFCVHYGIFTLGHGTFLFSIFIKDLSFNRFLFISILTLFISHGVSFLTNYIKNKEFERANLGILMFAPYGRVFIMQIVIIFTSAIVVTTGVTLPSLLLLILLKTVADLFGHMFEHKGKNVYGPAPWASKFLSHFGKNSSKFLESMYRNSVQTGEFDRISKDLSPEYKEYIQKFWDTPENLRSELVSPYETLGENKENDSI